ncbi:uncharacterized protein LOC129598096 [Paramacrobiotus metropolitanus]|uniref:uncharacterized protein LOC129598096 n=1 Tax=Paramacrobiotus metropolitanus TaxID=2943436 RepID=UPI002445F588|nr:uncharacterized protein LOC129598096 [Paramacrobiotus metropolitanus]
MGIWMVLICLAGIGLIHGQELLPHQMVLLGRPDAGLLVLRWRANATDVAIELEGMTRGWLAIGRSPDGRMDKSDILFAWVDASGTVYAQDRFIVADQNTMTVNLTLDKQQNWALLAGKQNGTHTVIRAMRKLVSPDPSDYPFTDNFHLVYSIGDTPPDRRTGEIKMHSSRGTRMFAGFTQMTPGPINTAALSSFATPSSHNEPQADSHAHPLPAISVNHDSAKALQNPRNPAPHPEMDTTPSADAPYDAEATTDSLDTSHPDITDEPITDEPFLPQTLPSTPRRNVFNALRPNPVPPINNNHPPMMGNHGTTSRNQGNPDGTSGHTLAASSHGSAMTPGPSGSPTDGSSEPANNLLSVMTQGNNISGNLFGFPLSWSPDGVALPKSQKLSDTVTSVMNALEQIWSLIGQLTGNTPTTPTPAP